MGTDVSAEELELLQMQVDDEYNPSILTQTPEQARQLYLQRKAKEQASHLNLKRMGLVSPASSLSKTHNVSRPSISPQSKPKGRARVTYIFENDQPYQDNDLQDNEGNQEDQDLLVAQLIQEKEEIRDFVTPVGGSQPILNQQGRSPYNGSVLKVVSLNHKNQSNDPVFDKPNEVVRVEIAAPVINKDLFKFETPCYLDTIIEEDIQKPEAKNQNLYSPKDVKPAVAVLDFGPQIAKARQQRGESQLQSQLSSKNVLVSPRPGDQPYQLRVDDEYHPDKGESQDKSIGSYSNRDLNPSQNVNNLQNSHYEGMHDDKLSLYQPQNVLTPTPYVSVEIQPFASFQNGQVQIKGSYHQQNSNSRSDEMKMSSQSQLINKSLKRDGQRSGSNASSDELQVVKRNLFLSRRRKSWGNNFANSDPESHNMQREQNRIQSEPHRKPIRTVSTPIFKSYLYGSGQQNSGSQQIKEGSQQSANKHPGGEPQIQKRQYPSRKISILPSVAANSIQAELSFQNPSEFSSAAKSQIDSIPKEDEEIKLVEPALFNQMSDSNSSKKISFVNTDPLAQINYVALAMNAFSGIENGQSSFKGKIDGQIHVGNKISQSNQPVGFPQSPLKEKASKSAAPNVAIDTLFEQFGGERKLRVFISDVVDAFMGESKLPHQYTLVDTDLVNLHKERMYQYFKFLFNGSKHYIGTPLEVIHKDMGISDELFDKAVGIIITFVKKMKPKLQVMREVIKRINDIRPKVVIPIKQEFPKQNFLHNQEHNIADFPPQLQQKKIEAQKENNNLVALAMNAFSGIENNQSSANGKIDNQKQEENKIPQQNQSFGLPQSALKEQASKSVAPNVAVDTLFDQFGGEHKLRVFISDVVDEFMGDSNLPHQQIFINLDLVNFHKEKMYHYLKFLFDGSKHYIGTPLEVVHKDMGITDELFDRAVGDIMKVLKKTKPKLQVMREVIKRINDIRPKVVIPIQQEFSQQNFLQNQENIIADFPPQLQQQNIKSEEESLFQNLGGVSGLTTIVQTVLELANSRNLAFFNRLFIGSQELQEFASRYATFLASIVDVTYEWYYQQLVESKQVYQLLVNQEDFETMLDLVNSACIQHKIPQQIVINLIDVLQQKKHNLCRFIVDEQNNNSTLRKMGTLLLIDESEEEKTLQIFIKRFLDGIEETGLLKELDKSEVELMQQDFANRISKILTTNPEELGIPNDIINLSVNENEPICVAARVFMATLLEVGVNKESAESLKNAFLVLPKNSYEEIHSLNQRIPSKLSSQNFSQRQNSGSRRHQMKLLSSSQEPAEEEKRSFSQQDLKKIGTEASEIKISEQSVESQRNLLNIRPPSQFKLNSLPSVASENHKSESSASGIESSSLEASDSKDFSKQAGKFVEIKSEDVSLSQHKPDINSIPSPVSQISRDLIQMLPNENVSSTKIIFEGPINKLVVQNCKLAQRHMVLNSVALFVYRDYVASKGFPHKPIVVIPLAEVASVNQLEMPKKFMAFENQRQMQISAAEKVFLLEINLKRSKQDIQKEISNFFCAVDKSLAIKNTIKKGVAVKQQQSMVEDDYKFIFADFNSKIIQKWTKKVSKCLDTQKSQLKPPRQPKQPKNAKILRSSPPKVQVTKKKPAVTLSKGGKLQTIIEGGPKQKRKVEFQYVLSSEGSQSNSK